MKSRKPCPICKKETLVNHCYLEDGATSEHLVCINCKFEADNLYIGATEWDYDRENAKKRSDDYNIKWELVKE